MLCRALKDEEGEMVNSLTMVHYAQDCGTLVPGSQDLLDCGTLIADRQLSSTLDGNTLNADLGTMVINSDTEEESTMRSE